MKHFITLLLIVTLCSPILSAKKNTGKIEERHYLKVQDKSFFIENKGQWPAEVKFLAKINGMNAWITDKGIVYDFYKIQKKESKIKQNRILDFKSSKSKFNTKDKIRINQVVRMTLDGASTSNQTFGNHTKEGHFNYFIGNDKAKWASNVPIYGEVKINNVYDGIDARVYFDNGLIRYDYIIKPNADISKIKMQFDGQDNLTVNNSGELQISTKLGEIKHQGIKAYQVINGREKLIDCKFTVDKNKNATFKTDDYDKTKELIIDPLVYSTYLGGSDDDEGYSISVEDGYAYITGMTYSSDFPLENSYMPYPEDESSNVFVTKLSQDGSSLVYSTYLGGNYDETGFGIAVENGFAYIAGRTDSPDFPTQGAFMEYPQDEGYNGFVTKLSLDGSSLIYSTYIGGNGDEGFNSIAVENGFAYVTGYSNSNNYPTQNPYIRNHFGFDDDAVVTKLSQSGNSLIYSTYIGGGDYDEAFGISVENGYAYITGTTYSTNYPTRNAFMLCPSDDTYNVFVTKFSQTGNSLVYSTYIGGNGDEGGMSISVENGYSYITGNTLSNNFPADNFFGQILGGSSSVYITKFSQDGSSLIYSMKFGGFGDISGTGISVENGFAYVTGIIDVGGGGDGGGDIDAFIIKLTQPGDDLIFGQSFGGRFSDYSAGICAKEGYAYITGTTNSDDYPTTNDAYEFYPEDEYENAFVTKYSWGTPILTTSIVTDIDQTTATSGGTIIDLDGAPDDVRGVCWNTSGAPTISDDHTEDGNGLGVFISYLTGLMPGTQYYVRAYDSNQYITAYGNEVTFTTLPGLATVTTKSISNITPLTASSGGNILSDGGAPVTQRGICWNTTGNPTTANPHTSNGTGTGLFSSNMTGLTIFTKYYVRAYVVNRFGTSYGNEINFTTHYQIPGRQDDNISFSSVTINSIALSWSHYEGSGSFVVIKAGSPIFGTDYPSSSDAYPATTTYYPTSPSCGLAKVAYYGTNKSTCIRGLNKNTAYYFHIFAYNGNPLNATATYNTNDSHNNPLSVHTARYRDAMNGSDPDELISSFEIVSVSPNPATDKIDVNLNLPDKLPVNFEIYDMKGSLVQSINKELISGANTVEIPLNYLASGNYMLKASSGEDIAVYRFVVLK